MSAVRSASNRDALASPTVTVRMTESEVRILMIYVIRVPMIFASAREQLTTDLFSPTVEGGAAILMRAVSAYYDSFRSLPPSQLLIPYIDREALAVGSTYPPSAREWAIETARASEHPAMVEVISSPANQQVGMDMLYRFLNERVVSAAIRHLAVQTPNHLVLSDVQSVINRLSGMVSRVQSVRTPDAVPLFGADDTPVEMPRLIPTGVPFLDDDILRGGTHAGKIYALFGPFGSFKTGLGCQIAVSAAERQLAEEDPGLVVYFVYEGGKIEIEIRCLAQAAAMPKETVENYFRSGRDASILSTSNSLKDYEVRRYERANTPPQLRLGESERVQEARGRLTNLYVKDMSGPEENPSAGTGYIPEILVTLERLTQTTGRPIRMIIIDYAKLMAMRYLNSQRKRMEELRLLVGNIPDELRKTVCNKFGCSAIVMQQLNTGANKKAAGAAQHHADSAESGAFAENVTFAITLSSVDRENNNTVNVNATKVRDNAGIPRGIVTRIDPDSFTLVVDPDHVVGATGRIVPRSYHQTVVAPPNADGPPPPPRRTGPNPAEADG